MASHNGESGLAQDPTKVTQLGASEPTADPKGKGKAVGGDEELKDAAMDEDDDDDEDEDEAGENDDDNDDEDDEDDMGEIDLDNVVGRRTRGRVIDFAKAAEQHPAADDDEDEDDDDDFEDPDNNNNDDKMDED